MLRLALLALIALALLPACGHAAAKRTEHAERARVRVTSGAASLLDPHAARLSAAMGALERAAGHTIDVEVDGALASGREGSFGEAIARELEGLARDISARERPGDFLFAGVLRDLACIEVSYEVVSPSRRFEPARGLLSVRVGVGGAWNASAPLMAEADRRFEERYGGRSPTGVPSEELELYASWLVREAEGDDAARGVRAIVPLLAVEGRLPEKAEARRAARLGVLRGMSLCRVGTPARAVVAVDAATQETFADWARARLSSMDATELDLLSRAVAAPPRMPRLDALALVTAAADAWVAAGRPVSAFGESDAALAKHPPLVSRVLSPGTLCPNTSLYSAIAESSLDALVRRLDDRGDGVLRAVVFLHLVEATCESGSGIACPRVEQAFCKPGLASLPHGIPADVSRRVASRCDRRRPTR